MREYLMGEREQPSDLMAWNVDTTRMPARMHNEYLTALYLHNALAHRELPRWRPWARGVAGRPAAADLHGRDDARPCLAVAFGLQAAPAVRGRDQLSFWPGGGHNAGIVSEPGHANRSYQIATRPAHGPWIEPEE